MLVKKMFLYMNHYSWSIETSLNLVHVHSINAINEYMIMHVQVDNTVKKAGLKGHNYALQFN